ncbi:MAG TPA: MFS transporter [Kouleothrix sp.]|uniref:MFS transporter n=1 Tax=Kouleothrix sp. TaxID=2779161 RepID=UPI002BEF6C48|nr:MFS transporter [Kouleothrix sp.]HRC74348.1 MFS transporter [Kouleothrix sp.]
MFANSPILGALRHRPFGTLWAGQVCSQIGDGLYHIALIWWVLSKSGSGFDLALVLACSYIPSLLFAVWGGLLADRLPRTRVMAVCDVLRGALMLLVALLAFGGGLELWHLYLVAALLGTAEAFFTPAYDAAVPWVAPATLLAGANALRSIGYDTSDIAGMTIGGLAIAAWGPALIFLLNAATFFVAAGCALAAGLIAGERRLVRAPAGETSESLLHEAAAGLRVVRDTPWLRVGIVACMLLNILQNAIMIIGLPLLVAARPGAQPYDLGVMLALVAGGSLVVAVVLGQFELPAQRLNLMFYGSAIVGGLAMLGFGLADAWWMCAAGAAIYGGTLTAGSLAWTRALQLSVPDAVFGRVSAVDNAVSWVFGPLGVLLAGALMNDATAAAVLTIGGASSVAVALVGLRLRATLAMDGAIIDSRFDSAPQPASRQAARAAHRAGC